MIDLKQYGYIETEKPDDGLVPARVTAVHRERYDLISSEGIKYGKLKTSVYYGREPHPFPTVGDFVLIKDASSGDAQIVQTLSRKSSFSRKKVDGKDTLIVETLPRKSYFSRMDPKPGGYTEQAVAANFDTVFIMQSLNQNFNLRRLERYLTLTWQSGATPVIILTKVDLIDDPSKQLQQVEEIAAGVDVVATSAITGSGLEKLEKYLKPGKTCVFLGSSGVGKSSLLNTLMGEDVMLVKEIREDDARGRHTTTHREMFTLPCGAHIIDTPGMREIGMWENESGELNSSVSDVFADVEEHLGACKFSDCRHESEPGCAIKAAIENGDFTQGRWESYLKLKREALYAEDKLAAMRDRSAKSVELQTWWRNRNKEIW